MNLSIRPEKPADHRAVEELTRRAFWNLYVPGAVEHFLVHRLRDSADFVPELDYVAVSDNRIVGSILYSRSRIVGEDGRETATLTFGPVSVEPALQGKGIGSALIEHTLFLARRLEYSAVVIMGYPAYYQRFGFRSAKEFGVWYEGGVFPIAHQVLELVPGALDGVTGQFLDSDVFAVNEEDLGDFDDAFPPMEKKVEPSQDLFAKTSHTFL